MSSKFAVFGKTSLAPSEKTSDETTPVTQSEYRELIRKLFGGRTAVAILGAGLDTNVTSICQAIAGDLSQLGRRVVVVSVEALLQSDQPAPSEHPVALETEDRQYWHWPPSGSRVEWFRPRPAAAMSKNWLECLRQEFDAVLIDCPPLVTLPGAAAIAAMADAAVLAVDAQRTSKQQIVTDQRLLLLSNVKLAGCILVKGD